MSSPFDSAQQQAATVPLLYTREAKRAVVSQVLAALVAALKQRGPHAR